MATKSKLKLAKEYLTPDGYSNTSDHPACPAGVKMYLQKWFPRLLGVLMSETMLKDQNGTKLKNGIKIKL